MDKPVSQTGTLDYLNEFGVEFMGIAPVEHGFTILLRCVVCGHTWDAQRSSPDFEKEATECPKAATSKKHAPKAPKKKE